MRNENLLKNCVSEIHIKQIRLTKELVYASLHNKSVFSHAKIFQRSSVAAFDSVFYGCGILSLFIQMSKCLTVMYF